MRFRRNYLFDKKFVEGIHSVFNMLNVYNIKKECRKLKFKNKGLKKDQYREYLVLLNY